MWLKDESELKRLYPPRAETAINPVTLDKYRGFIAQYKYNDIRTLIFIVNGTGIELTTRKREPHKEYRLTSAMTRALLSLNLDHSKNHVLDGGILRHVLIGKAQPIILWDILVHNDDYLLGTRYQERYELLASICGDPKSPEAITGHQIGLEIAPVLWLAPVFRSNFYARYEETLRLDFLEGVILKNPNGKLERSLRAQNNTSWQIKARKPRPGYSF